MERRKTQIASDAVAAFLRDSGLETPLLQYRVIEAWSSVVGPEVSRLSEALEVRGEVLWVRVSSPALLSDLQMRRSQLVGALNASVGAVIVRDIQFVVR